MPKYGLKYPRQSETRRSYLGKVLIVCEGQTEFLYFENLKSLLHTKYDRIELQLISAGGNAKTVLNYAEKRGL